jgi:hypothetical protein
MATNSDAEETKDSKDSGESLIDELIKDILTKAEPEPKGALLEEDPVTAALTGAAVASLSRTVPKISTVERLLLVEFLASSLAEALAPAIARAIAPEIMTVLGDIASPKPAGEKPAPAAGRKGASEKGR